MQFAQQAYVLLLATADGVICLMQTSNCLLAAGAGAVLPQALLAWLAPLQHFPDKLLQSSWPG